MTYPGNALAAPDPPPYPREWGPAERLSAYWLAVQLHGTLPTHTSGWYAMLNQSQRRSEHLQEILAREAEREETELTASDRKMPYKDD